MVLFGFLKKRVINISIHGLINQNKAFKIYKGLSQAKSYNVQAVVLSISSPFGSLVQAHNILDCIKTFTDRTSNKIPFYTFAEDFCLNSANLVLAGGDRVFANKFSLLGDLGYIQTSYGLKDYLNKHQIEVQPIGNNKNKISRLEPLQEKSKQWINKRLKGLEVDLKDRIKIKRPQVNLQNIKGGLNAQQALKINLIDEIGNKSEFLQMRFKDIKIYDISTQQTSVFSYDTV